MTSGRPARESRTQSRKRPTAEQRDIKALGMTRLSEDAEAVERFEPRQS